MTKEENEQVHEIYRAVRILDGKSGSEILRLVRELKADFNGDVILRHLRAFVDLQGKRPNFKVAQFTVRGRTPYVQARFTARGCCRGLGPPHDVQKHHR